MNHNFNLEVKRKFSSLQLLLRNWKKLESLRQALEEAFKSFSFYWIYLLLHNRILFKNFHFSLALIFFYFLRILGKCFFYFWSKLFTIDVSKLSFLCFFFFSKHLETFTVFCSDNDIFVWVWREKDFFIRFGANFGAQNST